MTVSMRAKVYKSPAGFWEFEVLEPDDDGYMVRVTDYGTRRTWREAMDVATGDALMARRLDRA